MDQQPPPLPPAQPYPQAAPAPPVAQSTNTLAIVSLATGIASWFLLPVVGAVIAVVTGHMAKREIRRTGEQGSGLATIGLILGYVHLAVAVLLIALLILVLVGAIAWFSLAPRTG